MYKPLVLSLALLATSASAKRCTDIMIPVTINARQGTFNTPGLETNLDATTFSQNMTKIGVNYTDTALTGYMTIRGNVQISAEFCQPDDATDKKHIVQMLIHGIGFDKTYWNLPYNAYNYSYVNIAVDTYGYSTLSIDRFGIGDSSIADPVNAVQSPASLSAIYEVTKKLRAGTVPSVPQSFRKIIHIGHSYGSVLTYELAAVYPDASDAVILTGYSQNGSYFSQAVAALNMQLARLNDPARFAALPGGYVAWADIGCNQYDFFSPGNFDPGMIHFSESTKMPATLGEWMTIGNQPSNAGGFVGPVMVVTGDADSFFCGFDCTSTGEPELPSIPAGVQHAFPAAATFEAYVQPNTGHALNMHYNATAGYRIVNDFLERNGLGARGSSGEKRSAISSPMRGKHGFGWPKGA